MPIAFTWAGLTRVLAGLLQPADSAANDWELALFVNTEEPSLDSVASDFVEAAFVGYVRYALDDNEWMDPVQTDDSLETQYGEEPLSWVNGGSFYQNIWGYFVLDNYDGAVLWAELFEVPRELLPTYQFDLTVFLAVRNDPQTPDQ